MEDLKRLYEIAEASCNTNEEIGELNTLYQKLEVKLKLLDYLEGHLNLDEMEQRLRLELSIFGTKNVPDSTQMLLLALKYYGRGN